MSRFSFLILVSVLFFSGVLPLKGADLPKKEKEQESIFDLMYSEEPLKINLIFSVQKLIDNPKSDSLYKTLLTFQDKNGEEQVWNLGVKARGVYRRYNCPAMPPLKLNFKKKDLKAAGLSKFDDYKLVTHCIEDTATARALVLKEYLAYKYFNILTKNSFRVQLLLINFVDSDTGRGWQQVGFLIEDFALLRHRLKGEKVKNFLGTPYEELDKKQFQRMALFQYMIGNSDWSFEQGRNVKVFKKKGKYVVIPYDFDFSGLVLAPYARLNPDYKLNSLRDRVYLGYRADLIDLRTTMKKFKRKKRKFRQMTKYLPFLETDHREYVLDYLDSFYKNKYYIQIPLKKLLEE